MGSQATGPSRRQGHLGIHSIDHFTLTVPELEPARRFYEAFGLDVREAKCGLTLHAKGAEHRWGYVREGGAKHLDHIAFGMFEDDVNAFRDRLAALGVATEQAPDGVDSNGMWLRAPDGLLLELRATDKVTPNAKSSFEAAVSAPGGQVGAYGRNKVKPVRPRRLSHMGLFTSDVPQAARFYSEALGIRMSDHSGGALAFMHGPHGSDHHLIALIASDGPGLHHVCWDVDSMEAVALGGMQMAVAGYAAGWGMGRHVLGSNYFHYIRDPWGSYCEYSADIDYIPADVDWQAGDHEPEDSMFLWGPNPPEDFIKNYETAR